MTTSKLEQSNNNNSFGVGDRRTDSLSDFAAFNPEGHTPCIRYGTVTNGEFSQERRLAAVDEDPPEKAKFCSPMVYYVSEEQSQRLYEGTPPKTIQKGCEQDGRAFFKVVAESDALEDSVEGETVANWLQKFAEEYAETENYDLFFSGNRSLHLHTDRWVQYGELEDLKSLAQSFNAETDGELDTSIYQPKPQFRLTGTEHEDTSLYKVPIREDFSRANLVRQAQSEPSKHSNTENTPIIVAGIASRGSLLSQIQNQLLHPYLKESVEVDETWSGKPFSPYALTGGGDYSVCILGYDSLVERDGKHYARGVITEALGGDGQYSRYNSFSEVRLSPHDAEKWDFHPGETVVIIGGRSRKSKLLGIATDEALLLEDQLREEGRDSALALLQRWDYDTGERGLHESNYDNTAEVEGTPAAKTKWAIDSGRQSPDYDDYLSVTCRLLRVEGWQAAWDWLERTLGEDFNPKDTHNQLETLVETYGDSFEDVTVPTIAESEDDVTQKDM